MKKSEMMKNLGVKEWQMLKKNISKEINYLFSLSFKTYMLNLVFPKNTNSLMAMFRFLTLYMFVKFFFDVFLFIFMTIFNFYFIIFDSVFSFLKEFNYMIFSEGFFFKFNLKMINFFSYMLLFMFFVNMSNDIKKKQIKWWLYVFEFFADVFIKLMSSSFSMRYSLYPALKILEVFILFLYMLALSFSSFFDSVMMPLFQVSYESGYEVMRFSYSYYRVLFKYNAKGPFLFTDVSLFQMSTMLQKNGFMAPICEDKVEWYKAKLAYSAYRSKYLKAELTPDVVDKDALNIYIFLKDLLKDTRYQRKYMGVFDLLKVWFPFSLLMPLFFFLIYFTIGMVYMMVVLSFPIGFLMMCFYWLHIIYGVYYHVYCLLFKDMEFFCMKLKQNEIRNAKYKQKIYDIYSFYYGEIVTMLKIMRSALKKMKIFFNSIYEKIFR